VKKVTRCHNCGKVIRVFGSFTAKLEQPELLNGRLVDVIKLCRECSKNAGYKVKEN
jgi:DNA-directed RNA polymerase subunit N (RpoN/RPB10)